MDLRRLKSRVFAAILTVLGPGMLSGLLLAQSTTSEKPLTDDDFKIYTEHPRLLLNARRLRLLRRERERTSMRWEQFQTLVKGGVAMPEKGAVRLAFGDGA